MGAGNFRPDLRGLGRRVLARVGAYSGRRSNFRPRLGLCGGYLRSHPRRCAIVPHRALRGPRKGEQDGPQQPQVRSHRPGNRRRRLEDRRHAATLPSDSLQSAELPLRPDANPFLALRPNQRGLHDAGDAALRLSGLRRRTRSRGSLGRRRQHPTLGADRRGPGSYGRRNRLRDQARPQGAGQTDGSQRAAS